MRNAFLYAFILLAIYACVSKGEVAVQERINGVCFVAPPHQITAEVMQPIREANAGWIAVVPYAFTYKGDPHINYDTSRQWWGERSEGVIQTITYAHQAGLKVMLKPHVWVIGQGWPGDFTLESEAEWQVWEEQYGRYLRTMTDIADSMGVEMLCIGTEYRHPAAERPDFWKAQIQTIRARYSGLLTYAANWDNFQNITFWDQLDYIGIDAYFPLCEQKTPTLQTLRKGWQEPLQQIKNIQSDFDKPILFTEYGYQSADYMAKGHWEASQGEQPVNLEAQQRGYQVLYEVFWEEPWFAGGFLWKWFADHSEAGGEAHNGYTPQNKPALSIIKEVYAQKPLLNEK